jgi:hypothetical protein
MSGQVTLWKSIQKTVRLILHTQMRRGEELFVEVTGGQVQCGVRFGHAVLVIILIHREV